MKVKSIVCMCLTIVVCIGCIESESDKITDKSMEYIAKMERVEELSLSSEG